MSERYKREYLEAFVSEERVRMAQPYRDRGEEVPWDKLKDEARAEFFRRAALEDVEGAIRGAGLSAKDLALIQSGEIKGTLATAALEEHRDATFVSLSGLTGCGKTFAAALWVHRKVAGGNSGLFLTAPRLSRWPRYDSASMERLLAVSSLVVDDLGVEYLDERGALMSLIDEVINERYSRSAKTVITTNLSAQGFRDRYGERVYDRLREAGRFVNCGHVSMRGRR